MKKLNKDHYIAKCEKCGNIYVLKPDEIIEQKYFSFKLRFYKCKPCNKTIKVTKLNELTEFAKIPRIQYKTEFDPKENDHQ